MSNEVAIWKDPFQPRKRRRLSRGNAFVAGLTGGLLTAALIPFSMSNATGDGQTPSFEEIAFCQGAADEAGVKLGAVTSESEDSIHTLRCFNEANDLFDGRVIYATPVVE